MKALVTGGGGFLGSVIIRQLRARGEDVRSFSRARYPLLDSLGIEQHQGDVGDAQAVLEAANGCDIVFHVAAKAGIWGPYREYYRTNVVGTQNVIQACLQQGVAKLVYTSSPSVVFDGRDMEGVDETVPYPGHYETHYPRTKMMAERQVLEASRRELATVSLRPHLIWGPGDNHLVPRIVERGRAGLLRRIGREPKLVDSVYIDDAARAHILAADRLSPESPLAGKAYFISQDDPIPIWNLVNKILDAAGVPPVERHVHPRVAYAAGCVLEGVHKILRLRSEPRMTRFLARELSTAHWFDISAARRDFGYEPTLTIDEGIERLRASFEVEDRSPKISTTKSTKDTKTVS